jgi:hypothetical protein
MKHLIAGASVPDRGDADILTALNEVAESYSVDPAAIAGMIHTESVWDPRCVTGSYIGLTQVGPELPRLLRLSKEQFLALGSAEQIRAYGKWLAHYRFTEQLARHGMNVESQPLARQAAVLQAMQFSPNGSRWKIEFARGNYAVPATSSRQAQFLGDTSIHDMEAYYSAFFRQHPPSYAMADAPVETTELAESPELDIARAEADAGVQPAASAAAARTPSIVTVARAEFDRFHGIDEGDQPLRRRIADYYEAGGGSRNLDPTRDENAWSAAFISFCVKQSGATSEQFAFSLRHSVFVHAAIANADAGRGVFRGHRVTAYAPKLGDLIHHNRSGSALSFDFARAHADYPSHSAVVVGFEPRDGVRNAVTIGGNEFLSGGTSTVGKKFFALDSNGLLNQRAIGPKLICVVENRLAAGAVAPAVSSMSFVVNVRTDLKLRGGPGTEFPVIRSLLTGTTLNVLEFQDVPSGRWALVDLEGDGIKDGFVFAKFIERIVS